jgi:hypothetical protein
MEKLNINEWAEEDRPPSSNSWATASVLSNPGGNDAF